MPYKDKEKQRKAVRLAVRRHHQNVKRRLRDYNFLHEILMKYGHAFIWVKKDEWAILPPDSVEEFLRTAPKFGINVNEMRLFEVKPCEVR